MKKVTKILLKVVLILIGISLLSVFLTKYIPVCYTPFMLRRTIEYASEDKECDFKKKWVPLEEINKNMVLAVVASEDNLFMMHSGFDWDAIEMARKYNDKGKKVRGGSTISQQTAKNVFTFGHRTYFRKGVEAYYTFLIELIWGKRRIMEVYLNVVEFGDNIYGVEAASQNYFHHSAAKLSAMEAARLAAVLPSPHKYRVNNPGPYVQKRSSQILYLMKKVGAPKF